MLRTVLLLVCDLLHFVVLTCSSHTSLAAENLFLRKQLAFYIERQVKPRRLDGAARIAAAFFARSTTQVCGTREDVDVSAYVVATV